MKGIRKVFLGLVFMTLFCVGFSASVKAEPAEQPDVKVQVVNDNNGKWTDNTALKWEIKVTDLCFPDAGEDVTYSYSMKLGEGKTEPYKVKLSTTADGNTHSVEINDKSTEYTEAFTTEMRSSMKSKDLKDDYLKKDDNDNKSCKFEIVQGEDTKSEVTVTAYKVTTKPITGGPTVEYNTDKEFLLLGESTIISFDPEQFYNTVEADGKQSVYRYKGMTSDSDDVVVEENDETSVKVTMNGSDQAEIELKYGSTTLAFSEDIDTSVSIDAGSKLQPARTVMMTGDKYTSAYKVYVNGVELGEDKWTWSPFYFTVPADAEPGTAELKIEMEDGNAFIRHFTIKDAEPTPTPTPGEVTVKITVSPSEAGTVTAKVVDIETGKTKDSDSGTKTVTVTGSEGDLVAIEAKEDQGNAFTSWEVTSGEVEIDEDKLSQEFNLEDENVEITAIYEDPGPEEPIEIDTIRVTSKQKVRLGDFAEDPEQIITLKTLSKGDYIERIEGTHESGSDNKFKLSKLYVTASDTDTYSSKETSITVNGQEMDVLVYGYPQIKESSDSIVVYMPEGDCHHYGDTPFDVETLKKARIYFKGSNDDEEHKDVDLSEHKKSFDKMDLGKDLADDDEYDFDCESITMKAHPLNGSNYDKDVYAEKKFYKIKLDESGGAKYTVNDEEVSNYFYAAEGMEYKIKCSAKNGGSFQKWDNSEFSSESGGTFKPNGSKTFKAIYTGSSSYYYGGSSYYYGSSTGRTTATGGTGSGGSGGDYDDVPKTGESKTDIWILWSVLLVSILGAGFMIYKRFGLVRAIAEADREEAEVVQQEMAQKEQKDKENMINTLKGLRKL